MNGENLFNAATVIYKAGEEIDAMLEKMSALLKQKLESIEGIRKVEFLDDDADNTSDWVYHDLIQNYGIYKRGARNPGACLAIQIKLFDTGEAEIVGPRALLYVLFSSGEWKLNEFLLHSAVGEGFELEQECLWQRYDEDEDRSLKRSWEDTECAYVVPLTAINTPEDVRTLIIDPIYCLMTSGLNSEKMDRRILRFHVEGSKVSLLS
ncbi:hypothetical protein DSCW_05380 [Desulfosarcina widdelii]|uniref:Uncharacterized protein n=1 Tax=Desulfosarcina widdelii TaxID=947919 RepID=A0A5K7Z0Y1_9BACT|nr:hypothetical protein [Desulfosarcina widdelii]BBO73121.1 hypothetical protein DSCW_05380 [Desulfosarcina widdelii]